MNLPNKLTIARLFLTALFVAAMSVPWLPQRYTLALALFLIAAITDFLDGYLARRSDLVTDFGKLMDPLADKILTGSVFIILSAEGLIPAWCTILIISREFLVTGLRLIASSQGSVVSADRLGKWKTTLQIITACYFLVSLGREEWLLRILAPLYTLPALGAVLIAATVIITTVSGLTYLRNNRQLVRSF